MWHLNKFNPSSMLGAVLMVGALMAPGTSQAREWEVRDFSDGGFEIEFNNGCTVTYDRDGNRENSSRDCKNKQINSADNTARSHHNSNHGSSSSGNSIPEGQMRKYCQGEASGKLGVRPNYIITEDVERHGDKYVVRGEESDSNRTFKCTFNRHGEFVGVDVNSHGGGHSSSGNSIPEGQMRKYCQGEASGRLDVRPNYIITEDVERHGDKYVVRGEESDSNRTFKCTFNRDGEFVGVDVNSHGGGHGSNNSGDIPRSAKNRCTDMFGNSPEVTSVSALRPGYWEVIMQDRNGPRSAACTITSGGEIEDWVELN